LPLDTQKPLTRAQKHFTYRTGGGSKGAISIGRLGAGLDSHTDMAAASLRTTYRRHTTRIKTTKTLIDTLIYDSVPDDIRNQFSCIASRLDFSLVPHARALPSPSKETHHRNHASSLLRAQQFARKRVRRSILHWCSAAFARSKATCLRLHRGACKGC